jgi:hypothetical protein
MATFTGTVPIVLRVKRKRDVIEPVESLVVASKLPKIDDYLHVDDEQDLGKQQSIFHLCGSTDNNKNDSFISVITDALCV